VPTEQIIDSCSRAQTILVWLGVAFCAPHFESLILSNFTPRLYSYLLSISASPPRSLHLFNFTSPFLDSDSTHLHIHASPSYTFSGPLSLPPPSACFFQHAAVFTITPSHKLSRTHQEKNPKCDYWESGESYVIGANPERKSRRPHILKIGV